MNFRIGLKKSQARALIQKREGNKKMGGEYVNIK